MGTTGRLALLQQCGAVLVIAEGTDTFWQHLNNFRSKLQSMSRGFGSNQRRVLDALVDRRDNDSYAAADVTELVNPDDTPLIRARWRWYTVDLLDLVEIDAPRPERVSLHRAIRNLHQTGQLEIATACPYPKVLGGYQNLHGLREGGLYVQKLGYYQDLWVNYYADARWPYTQGRRLWFRLPPPANRVDIPVDDQIAVIDYLHTCNPSAFQDFTDRLRRHREEDAWTSPVGRFVRWLFCGPPA